MTRASATIEGICRGILEQGEASWKLWLFDFVDDFRRQPAPESIAAPPTNELPPPLRSLLASTVEALCQERGLTVPLWCREVPALPTPWFVSGVENLKATALVESPAHFRKRNLFVLANFLERV